MLIRIKQVRKLADGEDHGTDIPLGKGKDQVVLQFRPIDPKRPDRDHVCDVQDAEHIATLLAIKEGFEVHPTELKTAAGKAAADRAAAAGSEGKSVDDLSEDELEAALERKRAAKAKKEGDGSEKGGEAKGAGAGSEDKGAGKSPDEMDRDELLAAVEKKTGKKPNPSTSTKKLKELLAQ